MSHRRESLAPPRAADAPPAPFPLAVALRRAFAAGYDASALRADVLAGSVVGVVAVPLSMALAIAVGVPPQHGLYTAIVAGAVVALAGGSKFQVTGPTAAFIVILAPIVARHGLQGLLTAGCMAGVLLIVMGFARLGRLIEFIPHPVTTGFTAGIATVIATLQLKDALGLQVSGHAGSLPETLHAFWGARASASGAELAVAIGTLTLLLAAPRLTRRVPAPLIGIGLASVAVASLHAVFPAFMVATIGSRFTTMVEGVAVAGIPPWPPLPRWPWDADALSFGLVRELLPAAFAIAMLGAIESLLSAVIADGMTGKRHDPDAELVGLGLGNVVAPFFGGTAATGALARTATNVRSGACSPVAAVVHALVVLTCILVLAPLVAFVPMAALAGLLLLVAWNMSEGRHFLHVLRVAPKSDTIVLVTCYALTVLTDMVLAISAGIVLAALLFMKRMAELTHSRVLREHTDETSWPIPRGVALYEIAGALFFGAAQKAMGALATIGDDVKVVVLGLGRVPVIDATGLVALESALDRLRRGRKFVIVAGPLPEPRSIFERAQLEAGLDHVLFAPSVERALEIAADLMTLNPEWRMAAEGRTGEVRERAAGAA
jgi:SulP family sulfate permease